MNIVFSLFWHCMLLRLRQWHIGNIIIIINSSLLVVGIVGVFSLLYIILGEMLGV